MMSNDRIRHGIEKYTSLEPAGLLKNKTIEAAPEVVGPHPPN